MADSDFFVKKFSVGLNLKESLADIARFMEKNRKWLNSVYFSVPLGMKFYSREELAEEYSNAETKLIAALDILNELGIRREMAINTWYLTSQDLEHVAEFCDKYDLSPEEIVCLKDYGKFFRQSFLNAEIKYSVNNPESDGSKITPDFHTLVAGKGLLRDIEARHSYVDKGYSVTLLLNNGCVSICNTICESIKCHRYFDSLINAEGIDLVYAKCSFFPSELKALIMFDEYSKFYKYKISNRPLGLEYTQQVLDAYLSLQDDYEAMTSDYRKMARFCTAGAIARKLQHVNLEQVKKYKEQWIMEMQRDCNRKEYSGF